MGRCFGILLIFLGVTSAAAAPPDFDAQIAPLLATRCLDCHSGAEPKGKLDLSLAAAAAKGGETGPAVVGGSLEKSLLWERVAADEMPPKKPLAEPEKQLLREWIASGAKWGSDPIDPFRFTTTARAGYDWWSLQPINRVPAPKVKNQAAVKNDIDRFVIAKLESSRLTPSPVADRRTLIRRLSFDLIGLPPTPEEVENFVNDTSAEAYAKLVNRLLDSPHYGERWARHWLDIVHFGESDGLEYDRMRPNAWPYRDWVINALNRDLPFDEFARLQIAGDILRPDDLEAITAAGFLIHGAHDNLLPAGDVMRQIMRQDELEDIVGLVGQTFLGLTVHCARCHDHKFDPILSKDYYRLASSLAGVKRGDRQLPPRPLPEELPKRLTKLREELKQLSEAVRGKIAETNGSIARPEPPKALARWEFDQLGDDLKLEGGAKLMDGVLVVDGKGAYAGTKPITSDIRGKTLEAWVKLDNLEQRGGAAISLQTLDGGVFDAIVFGERDPGRWMAGSEGFVRTKPLEGPEEKQAKSEAVHFAIVYAADGTITAYRNGELYGKPYKSSGPATFAAGRAQVVFGLRHSPAGGNKMLAGRIERAALYDRALTAEEVANSAATAGNVITPAQLLAAMTKEERSRYEQLSKEVAELSDKLARLISAVVYTIKPEQPPGASHVLMRGSPVAKGEIVTPGGIASLKFASADFQLDATSPEGDRRRKLAEWIARDDNPLFARTIVNRLWHYHFGRGLIETPNDLGFNGGQPSHPELLDYLASELIASGWSLKHLQRLIVSSATFQRSSLPRVEYLQADKDNRLLWRYSPHRLEAESVRDAVLSVAGELNPQLGGPSFQDFRPYENHNAQYYEPIDPVGPQFQRRSIYRMWARGGRSPLLDTLDCPDPSTMTPKRGSTTTPLQALAMLNNSFMLRMSDSMAARVQKDAGEDLQKQVERAFELAYSRPAKDEERIIAAKFVERNGLSAFCRVLLNTNGFLYVD